MLAALICPPALADDGATASVDLQATIVPPPCCVHTLCACNIGYTSATLWGWLICKHPHTPVTVSFGWDDVSHEDDPDGYAHWTTGKTFWFGVIFHAFLSGLEPDTTYYFRARAQTGDYTCYGEEVVFKTLPELCVITLPAGDIEAKQATLYGKTIGQFMSPKVQVSIGWDTASHEDDPDGYAHWTPSQYAWVGETFHSRLNNLTPNTTYFYRAKAERGGVVCYGEEMSFTTPPKHCGPWGWWDWFCGCW